MMSFDSFCSYAKIDEAMRAIPEEEEVALLCYESAIDAAKGCGIPVERLDAAGNRQLELYIYALAGHYYDNRNFISSVQSYTGDQYTQRMMTRMRIALESEGWF